MSDMALRIRKAFQKQRSEPALPRPVPLADWVFKDETYGGLLGLMFARMLGGTNVPPVQYRDPVVNERTDVPWLVLLGETLGLTADPATQRLLEHHRERLRARRTTISLLYESFYFLLIVIVVYPYLRDTFDSLLCVSCAHSSLLAEIAAYVGSGVLTLSISFLLAIIGMRLISMLLDQRFVESLCVANCVYLLTELGRDDALTHPRKKRQLLLRFRTLSRLTVLLGARYSRDSTALGRDIREQFRLIAGHLSEKERSVVMPTASTLEDLRREMREITDIYIKGHYGDFGAMTAALSLEEPPKRGVDVIGGVLRAAALLLPIGVLVLISVAPQEFTSRGIQTNGIVLFLLVWLVMLVDSVLKLGVISGIVGLIRSVRDLG